MKSNQHQLTRWNRLTGPVECLGTCEIDYDNLIAKLGSEHHVEEDPTRTRSGTERTWVFNYTGIALAFLYADCINQLNFGSNSELENPLELAFELFGLRFDSSYGLLWD